MSAGTKPRLRLAAPERDARDRAITERWMAGESQARLARAFGLTASGVNRILDRVADAWAAARAEAIGKAAAPRRRSESHSSKAGPPDARKTGRRAVWPDCPPDLRRDYRKIRSVIGSEAAKAQLTALCRQKEGNSTS
jgi:hypothetical protein